MAKFIAILLCKIMYFQQLTNGMRYAIITVIQFGFSYLSVQKGADGCKTGMAHENKRESNSVGRGHRSGCVPAGNIRE